MSMLPRGITMPERRGEGGREILEKNTPKYCSEIYPVLNNSYRHIP